MTSFDAFLTTLVSFEPNTSSNIFVEYNEDTSERARIQYFFMENGATLTKQQLEHLEKHYNRTFEEYQYVMGDCIEVIIPALRRQWLQQCASEVTLDACLCFNESTMSELITLMPKIKATLNMEQLSSWIQWCKKYYNHSMEVRGFIDQHLSLGILNPSINAKDECLHFTLQHYTYQNTYEPVTKVFEVWKACCSLHVDVLNANINWDGVYAMVSAYMKMVRKDDLSWHSDLIAMYVKNSVIINGMRDELKDCLIHWLKYTPIQDFKQMCEHKDIYSYYTWPLTYRMLDSRLRRLSKSLDGIFELKEDATVQDYLTFFKQHVIYTPEIEVQL